MSGTRRSTILRAQVGADGFLADLLDGLSRKQKSLPPKYFYDEQGSELFDAITRLPEYYLYRAESAIIAQRADEIAELCQGRASLVEFGSGSFGKALAIIDASRCIDTYAPCDISAEFLDRQRKELRRLRPLLNLVPIVADFTQPLRLPPALRATRCVGLFLGSTIGNFDPGEARALLANFARSLGGSSLLFVGADLVKDAATLERAYDDSQAITARFNLNLLTRVNRELGAEFDLARFQHRALYNRALSRIEMHLVSRCDQVVRIGRRAVTFRAGESIHTENSYKYTLDSFAALAHEAGWSVEKSWRDPEGMFSLHALRLRASERQLPSAKGTPS